MYKIYTCTVKSLAQNSHRNQSVTVNFEMIHLYLPLETAPVCFHPG